MALRVVGATNTEEQKLRKNLEEQYASYLHKIVDELFTTATYNKDWTWGQFARAAGVSYTTVFNLGNRETRYPRHMTVWKLAKAVGLNYVMEYPEFTRKSRRKAG